MLKDDPAMENINSVLVQKVSTVTKEDFFQLSPLFRRYLFDLSLQADQALRVWILADPESFTRLSLLKHCRLSELSTEEKEKIKSDPSVMVRRQLVLMQIKEDILPSQSDLERYACDSNRSLREIGRFYLKKYYSVEAYSIYKAREDESFYYITDYAKKEDIGHFINGVSSSNKELRHRCLQALANADWQRLKELDLKTLLVSNRKDRKLVCTHLSKLYSSEELKGLRSLFECSSPNGLIIYLNMLREKSYWLSVDEAFGLFEDQPEHPQVRNICECITPPASLFERLDSEMRDRIEQKLANLKKKDCKEIQSIAKWIEFCMPNP